MTEHRRKTIAYASFIGFVCTALLIDDPRPERFALSLTAIASGYGSLLVSLGGFAITVLALTLGLESLDLRQSTFAHRTAHAFAVRQVAISLAVACIVCFAGANLMSEVTSLGTSLDENRRAATSESLDYLTQAGASGAALAKARIELNRANHGPPDTEIRPATTVIGPMLESLGASGQALSQFREQATRLDESLTATTRRHFVVTSVTAFLASFLILQSLTFLLRMKFPLATGFTALQDAVLIGVGGILMVKFLHFCTYGLSMGAFYGSRVAILVALVGIVYAYGSTVRKSIVSYASEDGVRALRTVTPIFPYAVVLSVLFLTMLLIAATYYQCGPPTVIDRLLAGAGAVLATGLLLVIQVEQPMIAILRIHEPREPDPSESS